MKKEVHVEVPSSEVVRLSDLSARLVDVDRTETESTQPSCIADRGRKSWSCRAGHRSLDDRYGDPDEVQEGLPGFADRWLLRCDVPGVHGTHSVLGGVDQTSSTTMAVGLATASKTAERFCDWAMTA